MVGGPFCFELASELHSFPLRPYFQDWARFRGGPCPYPYPNSEQLGYSQHSHASLGSIELRLIAYFQLDVYPISTPLSRLRLRGAGF